MFWSWLVSSPCVPMAHTKRPHTETSELPSQRNRLEKMGQNGEDSGNCGDMIYKGIERLGAKKCIQRMTLCLEGGHKGSVIRSCDFQRHRTAASPGYRLRTRPGKASLCGREFRKIRRQRSVAEITSEEVKRFSESRGREVETHKSVESW